MKSSFFVITWTIIFIAMGLFNHQKINEFSFNYIDEFTYIEEKVKEGKWEQASYNLKDTKYQLEEEKNLWYKLINHGYLNEVFASIEILRQSIALEDEMISLQELEKIKMVFNNLMEDECFDFNRIF